LSLDLEYATSPHKVSNRAVISNLSLIKREGEDEGAFGVV